MSAGSLITYNSTKHHKSETTELKKYFRNLFVK